MKEWLLHQWHEFRRFLHSRDALVYLMFVLLATIIWFSNAFSSRREVTFAIPVTYANLPDDYIFIEQPADHIRIRLEDEGVDLFRNRKRELSLTFDISFYIDSEEGQFIIPMDEIRQMIAQQLMGDAGLVEFTPEVLRGSYTRQHEKIVPVVYTGQAKPAPQHQFCSEVQLTPSEVSVYGTEQQLAQISSVATAMTDYEGITDTFVTRLPLICPPGLRLLPDSVQLSVVSEQFTEKALTVPIRTPDLSDKGQILHLFPEQVTVTFRVGTAWFASITEQDMEAYVDMPQPGNDHLSVKVVSLNQHITRLRVKPEEVEYLIEAYETPTDGGLAAPVSED